MDIVESAAMWKLYGKNDDCVAIRSTVSDLKRSLAYYDDHGKGTLYLQNVRYINESHVPNSENYLDQMFEKRLSFEYENEFRALYFLNVGRTLLSCSSIDLSMAKHDAKTLDGLSLEIDVKKLINSVYISPTASTNFKSIVEKILNLAGFEDINCIQSELYNLK